MVLCKILRLCFISVFDTLLVPLAYESVDFLVSGQGLVLVDLHCPIEMIFFEPIDAVRIKIRRVIQNTTVVLALHT